MKKPKVYTLDQYLKLPKWYLDYQDKKDRQQIVIDQGKKIEKRKTRK